MWGAQVQQVAGHAFAELVERAAACDRIRGVLALLKRYDNLFRLPTRIRHASERGAYDQARAPGLIWHPCPLPVTEGFGSPPLSSPLLQRLPGNDVRLGNVQFVRSGARQGESAKKH